MSRRYRWLLALLAAGVACKSEKSIKLPETTMGDVVFGALYKSEAPVVVGPVTRRSSLNAGGYVLESPEADLRARLFGIDAGDLLSAAGAACRALPSGIESIACLDRLESCGSDPVPCLWAGLRSEICGSRLELEAPPAAKVYSADDQGRLSLDGDSAELFAALRLCGPELHPGCPLRLPGYVVTEGDSFVCVAPSRQLGCEVEMDLSACALGTASGKLDGDGRFSGSVSVAGCSISAGSATEMGLQCETRSFTLRFMESFIGRAECPRHGPPVFLDGNAIYPYAPLDRGSINGVLGVQPAGWTPRLVMMGNGIDSCRHYGCVNGRITGGCNTQCTMGCTNFREIDACRFNNRWAPCVGANEVEDCKQRCNEWCNTMERECDEPRGYTLAIAPTDFPEREVLRVDLDVRSIDPIAGPQGLVAAGPASQPIIVGIGLRGLFAVALAAQDLVDLAGFRRVGLTDLAAHGLLLVASDEVVVFGESVSAPGQGAALRVTLSGTTPNPEGQLAIDTLPLVDAAALGGSDGRTLFSTALGAPLGTARALVDVRAIDGSGTPQTVTLPGAPLAIGPLVGGAVAVGARGAGAAAQILVLAVSGGQPRVAATLDLPVGLVPRAFLADPRTCQGAGSCRVFIALDREGTAQPLTGLVGELTLEPGRPESATLLQSYVAVQPQHVTQLGYDPSGDRLLAISSPRDEIAPITVGR